MTQDFDSAVDLPPAGGRVLSVGQIVDPGPAIKFVCHPHELVGMRPDERVVSSIDDDEVCRA